MSKVTLTNTYERYPEYKDSGVEWLGEIPKNWTIESSKRIFKEKNVRGEKGLELGSVTQDKGIVLRSESELSVWNPQGETDGYKTIREGEFVLSLRSFEGGVEFSSVDALVSPAYTVMQLSKKHSKRFFRWLLKSDNVISALQIHTRGIRQGKNISFQDFSKIDLVLPPKPEQENIARFLDKETERIDSIIAKKQRLIELLKEKRTATINHALVNIKGSEVKLKQVTQINPSRKIPNEVNDSTIVSFVPMEAISDSGELSLQNRKYGNVKNGFTYFENGDVVLAKITPCFENGKAGVMSGLKNAFGFGTTEFIVLRPNEKIVADYLYLVVYSDEFRSKGEAAMKGVAGQKRLNILFLKNYQFPLPDLVTQKKVVASIKESLRRQGETKSQIEKSVNQLQELKSSLISHAVTGKIKV